MVRSTIVISIAIMITSPALAQNLLVNPGFDVPDQLNGWTCTTTDGIAYWSPDDRLGSAGSGSMEHEVSGTSDDDRVRCSQCVPIDEYLPYVASAWFFWPDDPDVSQVGSTRITFQFYSETDCSVPLSGGVGRVGYPILDTWLHLVTVELTAPTGAMSAGVFVFTWQDLANEPVRARLDDIDFSTTSLFRDGFESGDVDAWSFSTP